MLAPNLCGSLIFVAN